MIKIKRQDRPLKVIEKKETLKHKGNNIRITTDLDMMSKTKKRVELHIQSIE